MAKYVVNGEEFASKDKLEARCREVMNGIDEAGEQFLRGLLLHHPNAIEKIGSGVAHFAVGRNRWGGRMYLIRRTDGSNDHFSFVECIRYFHGTTNHARAQAISAFRAEVEGQVVEFRNNAYTDCDVVPCAITDRPISRNEAHVHHNPSFKALLTRFCHQHGVDLSTIRIASGTGANAGVDRIADAGLAHSWQLFHAENARLYIVEKKAHLKLSRIPRPLH